MQNTLGHQICLITGTTVKKAAQLPVRDPSCGRYRVIQQASQYLRIPNAMENISSEGKVNSNQRTGKIYLIGVKNCYRAGWGEGTGPCRLHMSLNPK